MMTFYSIDKLIIGEMYLIGPAKHPAALCFKIKKNFKYDRHESCRKYHDQSCQHTMLYCGLENIQYTYGIVDEGESCHKFLFDGDYVYLRSCTIDFGLAKITLASELY